MAWQQPGIRIEYPTEFTFELARYYISGLFDPVNTIGIGDLWTATLSGSSLTDQTTSMSGSVVQAAMQMK
jgi:hypothetical protein